VQDLFDLLVSLRPAHGPFLIGVTGGVAVGKSTLAQKLAAAFGDAPIVSTDCFLMPNSVIDAAGATMEKGFPHTFDREALRGALFALAVGRGVDIPSYSHRSYDIEAGITRHVGPADVVIVEGLHLTAFAADLLSVVVHLTAAEEVMEEWYVSRFHGLVAETDTDADSFYRLFVGLEPGVLDDTARQLWRAINRVNLRKFIEPYRHAATVVVTFDADHLMRSVERPAAEVDDAADAVAGDVSSGDSG